MSCHKLGEDVIAYFEAYLPSGSKCGQQKPVTGASHFPLLFANVINHSWGSEPIEMSSCHLCLKLTFCPGWTVKYDRFRDDVSPGVYSVLRNLDCDLIGSKYFFRWIGSKYFFWWCENYSFYKKHLLQKVLSYLYQSYFKKNCYYQKNYQEFYA